MAHQVKRQKNQLQQVRRGWWYSTWETAAAEVGLRCPACNQWCGKQGEQHRGRRHGRVRSRDILEGYRTSSSRKCWARFVYMLDSGVSSDSNNGAGLSSVRTSELQQHAHQRHAVNKSDYDSGAFNNNTPYSLQMPVWARVIDDSNSHCRRQGQRCALVSAARRGCPCAFDATACAAAFSSNVQVPQYSTHQSAPTI